MKCKKICFATRKKAKHYIKHLKGELKRKRCRCYKCDICDAWHFTTQTADEVRYKKEYDKIVRDGDDFKDWVIK